MDLIVHTYFTNWQILYISIAYLVKQAQNLCIAEQSWTKFLTKVIKKVKQIPTKINIVEQCWLYWNEPFCDQIHFPC